MKEIADNDQRRITQLVETYTNVTKDLLYIREAANDLVMSDEITDKLLKKHVQAVNFFNPQLVEVSAFWMIPLQPFHHGDDLSHEG